MAFSISGFFSPFKKFFAKLKAIVPTEQFDVAVVLVKTALNKFVDNSQRREWVVAELMNRFHLSESIARTITELALRFVKTEINKA